MSWHGSFSYLWKITFGINHQKWCFPAASISHYHNFKLLSYFCGTITSHRTVLSHFASKESNRYRAGRGWKYSLQIHVEYMTQPDEGSGFGEAKMIYRQCRERGTKKPHVSAGSILCSVLPVPVTLKFSFQLTSCATLLSYYQSVHWKHLSVCGGTCTEVWLLLLPLLHVHAYCNFWVDTQSEALPPSTVLCGCDKTKNASPIHAWNCWSHNILYLRSYQRCECVAWRCSDGGQWGWPSTSICALTLVILCSLKQTLVTGQPLFFLHKVHFIT